MWSRPTAPRRWLPTWPPWPAPRALQDGGDACRQAALVARRNHARVRECRVQEWNVAVVVVANTARLPGGVLDLAARGRAGPVGQ